MTKTGRSTLTRRLGWCSASNTVGPFTGWATIGPFTGQKPRGRLCKSSYPDRNEETDDEGTSGRSHHPRGQAYGRAHEGRGGTGGQGRERRAAVPRPVVCWAHR